MVDEMNAAKVFMLYFGRMTHFYASMRDWDFEDVLAHYGIECTHEEYVALFDKLVPALVNKEEER